MLNNIEIPHVSQTTVAVVGAAALAAVLSKLVFNYVHLSNIPGPFLARLTNLQRAGWVASNRAHEIHIEQHQKHGDVVRFGPNMVSVSDPREIPKIYKMHNPLIKVSQTNPNPFLASSSD
jgi:hypothetical protein